MNYLIGIALGVIATWLGICAVIVVAVLRSKAHDSAWEDERPEWPDDLEWLTALATTEIDDSADLTYQQMHFERWEAEL